MINGEVIEELEEIEEIEELDAEPASVETETSPSQSVSEPELWADYNAYADEEDYCYDVCTRVNIAIYEALFATISKNVAKETGDDGPVVFTDSMRLDMVGKIIAFNFDKMEDSIYMTQGSDGKLFLCGRWLNRRVYSDGKMIPMKKYLKKVLDDEKIFYLPGKNGSDLRKSMWYLNSEIQNSFNLSKKCKVETFRENFNPISFRKTMRDNAKRMMKQRIKRFISKLSGRKS